MTQPIHSNYQHWQWQYLSAGIVELAFARQNKSVNTINREVLTELETILDLLQKEPEIKGVILFSQKAAGFCAGADLEYLSALQNDIDAITDFVKYGQTVFAKLAQLPMTTVAQIHGHCLGGGLELALACDHRVVLNDQATRLGLPEVMLGIQPAWGGTVRSRHVLKSTDALQLLLMGRTFAASKAAGLGLVDVALPQRQLRRGALVLASKTHTKKQIGLCSRCLDSKPARQLIAAYSRRQLQKKFAEKYYPAPYQILANWEKYAADDKAAYGAEVASIKHLLTTNDTAFNLIRLFGLREKLNAFGKQSDFSCAQVHVVGAGVMGGDIAAWCALQGFTVTLQDKEPALIAPAIGRAYQLFHKKLRKPRLIQAVMDRLLPDVNGAGIAKADVVIEAIIENLEAKQQLFTILETLTKPQAILATNTSSFPLAEISQQMQDPSRLIGIHFFNPVAKMQLVEVVYGQQTSDITQQQACAFVTKIKHLPLPVLSKPGFLVNRILMPYLLEAFTMLEEGIPAEAIDLSATNFGMLMGPIELADTVGLDICQAVAQSLLPHYGFSVLYTESLKNRLDALLKKGYKGRKVGRGFYKYGKKKHPQKKSVKSSSYSLDDLAHRLILRMVNEAEDCLREQVVAEPDLVDAGMVFGAGFAPFRGGPMHYATNLGETSLSTLRKQLEMAY